MPTGNKTRIRFLGRKCKFDIRYECNTRRCYNHIKYALVRIQKSKFKTPIAENNSKDKLVQKPYQVIKYEEVGVR